MITNHISYLEQCLQNLFYHPPNNLTWPTIFEYFSAIHLSQTYNKPFFVWKDLSPTQKKNANFPNTDKGVDISEESFTILGQSKYYSESNTITYGKLATFLATKTLVGRNDLQLILLRTHHSSISSDIKMIIQRKDLTDIPINNSHFLSYCEEIKSKVFLSDCEEEEKTQFILRIPQQEAKQIISILYNSIIQLPTGLGKTILFLDYAKEEYIENIKNKFLILVPTLVLLDQWKDESITLGFPEKVIYTIGSESNNKITLKNYKDNTIFICVYNSFDIIKPYYSKFKKVCIDEAHRIFKPSLYIDEEDNDDKDDQKESRKASFPSGKEDKYTSSINNEIHSNKNTVLMSATIDKYDNFNYYSYSIRDAIDNNYLCDYQLVFPIFTEDPSDRNIAEYIIKKGETHMIIYTSSIDKCESFSKILNKLLPNSSKSIHSDINKSDRKNIINDFNEGKIRFLINVRVLVEGFNSPICSSILFLHMPSNDVFIIQAIGRSLRKFSNKLISNIYFPFNKEGDEKDIYNFIKYLGNSDKNIKDCITNKSQGTYLNFHKVIDDEENDYKDDKDDEKDIELVDFRYDLIFNSIAMSQMSQKTPSDKALLLLEFVKEQERVPTQKEEYKEVKLGQFWDGIKQGCNPQIYQNILSKNDILSKDYERVQKVKEKKKGKEELKPLA
jgi:superfamily II DNA or RNA helicase